MEVIVGKTSGFCFGVKNAVEKTIEQLEKSTEKVYCLNELVFNNQVMDSLKQKGLIVVETVDEAPRDSKLIIRAHGVEPRVYEAARLKNISIVDLTCPKVDAIHKTVKKYIKSGYYIFIIGKNGHPETVGTSGFCGEHKTIIESEKDIDSAIGKFSESNMKKIFITTQTTYGVEESNKIIEEVKKILKNLVEIKVENTICSTTKIRQDETKKISKEVDYMIIIGGKSSHNTQELYKIAELNCANTVLVQSKEDLDLERIKRYNKIGVMAGASTSKEIINEVIEAIERGVK
ncbi:MAG: 4-hydroxy-3-methylbut-2-enyl diphosphate reductase [Lachnospiraceae bacterium]|nr:4-hydroxy-3-methylbut-2-enyl diphosphate reductase [Lachnospiraceae bacterium]